MHLQYGEVRQAHFLERPNRFIAHVELEGETVVCHVKNTGRCRELLVPGATVYLERGTNPARRTAWDLIAVEKGHRLINMDAQAPNRIFAQWIRQLHELMRAVEEGHRATAFFVIQMADVLDFAPNDATHPAFGEALREAARQGVEIVAYTCRVTPETVTLDAPVPVQL